MSKTFGQLKAGDEVYVIIGSNVDIVKVSVAEPSPTEKHYTRFVQRHCVTTNVQAVA